MYTRVLGGPDEVYSEHMYALWSLSYVLRELVTRMRVCVEGALEVGCLVVESWILSRWSLV